MYNEEWNFLAYILCINFKHYSLETAVQIEKKSLSTIFVWSVVEDKFTTQQKMWTSILEG